MSKNVLQHLPLIEEHAPEYLRHTILSLIHVESAGNINARRTNKNGRLSEFCGVLQIGHAIAEDFGCKNTDFLGDPELSIKCFVDWVHRYRHILINNQELIFLGWKAGVGTVRAFKRKRGEGVNEEEITKWLNEERWSSGVYLDRCYAALKIYGGV